MAATRWTPEQQNAIVARGGSLLVSAGAGSGKTAVLTERVLSRLFDPIEPVDADQLLIVTYTRAAAQEMRQRIAKKIEDRQRQFPDDPACRRQRVLLDRAHISTVHSFCQELLRQNFQQLDLSPDFRMADEKELEVWRQETMSAAVEEFYRQGEPAFLDLVELLSAGRDDKALLDTAARLYDFARSHPFYLNWLTEKQEMYHQSPSIAQSPWGATLLGEAQSQLDYILLRSEQMHRLSTATGLPDSYGVGFQAISNAAAELVELLQAGQWDAARAQVRGLVLPTFRRSKKIADQQAMEEAVAAREELTLRLKTLGETVFVSSEAQFREDLADLQPKVEQLFGLAKRFDQLYAQRKQEHRAVDFSDLEHLALRLLVEPLEEGETPPDAQGRTAYRPTAYARQVADGYAEVFVDEFQDTNEVQDLIFRAVSQQEENLFLVGDVKQSIYRFRQAMPEIFLSKKASYAPYDGHTYPAKVDLVHNFRSRQEIAAGINFFFERLMTKEVGEIDYAAGEQLIPGAEYPPARPEDGPCVSVELVDMVQVDAEDKAAFIEADYVAQRIAQLLEQGVLVKGEEGERPLRPGDICILLRAPKGKGSLYREALERRGIGALADSQRSYLESREISAVLSVLRVVDNPLLDVPMAGALLSPLFAFTPEKLAELRVRSRKGSLWAALTEARQAGDTEVGGFLQVLEELRLAAASLPLEQLLIHLYDRTGAEAIFQTMEAGETRRQNLRLLLEHASGYEARGYRGLGGFLRFLDRLQEQGGDLSGSMVLSDSGESVRILSIHKSKGLEFPVVFLCDTAKSFNKRDLSERVLLHSTLGLAAVRREPDTYRQYTTIPLEAVKRDLQRASQSEEMRVLYVAMTRAKERLYITGAVPNLQTRTDKRCGGGNPLLPQQVAGCGSYLDWLLLALLQDISAGSQNLQAGKILSLPAVPICCRVAQWEGKEEVPALLEFTAPPDGELLETFRRRSDFEYPQRAATLVPTKLAISDLSQGDGVDYRFRQRPRFLYDQGLTPAEKGNALHKFMQFCNYTAARENPSDEIAKLVYKGYLTSQEGDAVDAQALAAFFTSPLAERIFASPRIWREYRFLAEAGAELLAPYTSLPLENCRTALQGVADCIFLEDGAGVVVDYKTDHVRTPEELLLRYRTQLLLYKELLGASLDIPIKECIIYSFGLSKEISVEG